MPKKKAEDPPIEDKPKKKRHLTFKEKTELKRKAAVENPLVGSVKEKPPRKKVQKEKVKEVKNLGGRPSSFDDAAPKIISYIRKGNTYECASGCARVSYSSFLGWMNKGKEDLENGVEDSKFLRFLRDVKQAETDAENEVLQHWKDCIPGNWQAAKEFLARRNPDKWAARDRMDVTSNGETIGKPVFLPLKNSEDDE